jgi:hypothetical protein
MNRLITYLPEQGTPRLFHDSPASGHSETAHCRLRIPYDGRDLTFDLPKQAAALDRFLATCGEFRPWALLRAGDPHALRLSSEENRRRGVALRKALHEKDCTVLPCTIEGRRDDWFLALGIGREEALRLGRAFAQASVITGSPGRSPRECACEPLHFEI